MSAATGDAMGIVDLGAQYPVSRLTLGFFWSTPWANGGRLEVGATPDTFTTLYDSGLGHQFAGFGDFKFAAQPVRYIRATDYFMAGVGPSMPALWSVEAFADTAPHAGYYPLSTDSKYFVVNLIRRPASDTQPSASVAYSDGALPFVYAPHPELQNPGNAIDGIDSAFYWAAPADKLNEATATLTVDLGSVQSIGAVRQYYGVVPLSSRVRVAQSVSGPWTEVIKDTPISASSPNSTVSFEPIPARYAEVTMKGTTSAGFASLAELTVYPSSASDPAPSSSSHLDLTYLTGMTYTPNANMGIAGAPLVHPIDGGAYFYVKTAEQGATGDGTLTVDLGQQFQVSEVDLSFYSDLKWLAGGKLEVDDGAGSWVSVFDTGRGTALGGAGGRQMIVFAPHTARYLRLTGYFDPALSSGILSSFEVFGDNVACVPNCVSGECTGASCTPAHCSNGATDGDEWAMDCGPSCPNKNCAAPTTNCTTDTDCAQRLHCLGYVAGATLPTLCVPPECQINPRVAGCGFAGARCGALCTPHPICTTTAQCPSGYQCGTDNGYRYGAPGTNVCELPGCTTTPALLGCGTTSAQCGLCECIPQCANKHCGDTDLSDGCGGQCPATCGDGNPAGCGSDMDCQSTSFCAFGQGARLGLGAGSNVCLPRVCIATALADCGTLLSTCGLCPIAADTCAGRECGTDPATGQTCGAACADGQFCSATGKCISFAADPPVQVLEGNALRDVLPPAAPPAPAFGATPGTFSVTAQGSASYSIPIDLPPGRHGVEPSLAIRYTSSTGNGALGVGWSLDGLSNISRCSRTYAQDGQARPVQMLQDAYCLDGQRLIEIRPGEFRTEIETFSKILQIGAEVTGQPVAFKVFTKDGRILTYGSESDSTALGNVKASGGTTIARVWALSRTEDRNQNFIRFRYRQTTSNDGSSSELAPESITYTGAGTIEGDREIQFEYTDTRPDKLFGYQIGGGLLARTVRLEHIKVLASHKLVRKYDLYYQTAVNGASRLLAVQECAGPNSICKGPTAFGYKTEQGFDAGTPFTPASPDSLSGAPQFFTPFGTALTTFDGYDVLVTQTDNASFSPTTPLPGGMDMAVQVIPGAGWMIGAGIDLINLFGAGADRQDWFVGIVNDFKTHKAYGDGYYSEPLGDGFCDPTDPSTPHVIRGLSGDEHLYYTCSGQPLTFFIDVDGDGVQDRLQCSQNRDQVEYYLARKHGHSVPVHVNGLPSPDGAAPALNNVCASQFEWELSKNLGIIGGIAPPEPPFIASFDVDGDGSGNLVVHDVTGWNALFFDGPTPQWRRLSSDPIPVHLNDRYVAFLDANGDGLRDVLSLPSEGSPDAFAILWVNTGEGFRLTLVKSTEPGDFLAPKNTTAYVVDYDRDGVDEIIQGGSPDDPATPHPWIIRHFNNGIITREEMPAGPLFPGALGDFDGDGNLDLVTRKVGTYEYFMHHGSGRLQNALEYVIDGLGRRVDVQYDLVNPEGERTYDASGVTAAENLRLDCDWPNSCTRRVDHLLVSSFQEKHSEPPDFLITDSDTRFSYRGAIDDAAGLGRLGFLSRKTTVRDSLGGLRSEVFATYTVPPSSATSVRTGQGPIEAPYHRAMVGLPLEVSTRFPHADSNLSAASDDVTSTISDYTWIEKTSVDGRPFVALQEKITSAYAYSVGFYLFNQGQLYKETEHFELDGYGNMTNHSVVKLDHDPLSFTTSVVPGSISALAINRNFEPTAEEIKNWQISLVKWEKEVSIPRCYEGAIGCTSEVRTRRNDYGYYPSGELRHVTRAIGVSDAQRDTELERDGYGNVFRATTQDLSGDTRVTTIGFDTRGMFPISVTDGLAHTTQLRYDDRFGKIAVQVDPNQIAETWSYDEFGVLRNHSGPGGTETLDYELDQRTVDDRSARYATFRQVSGGPGTIERYNSLGQIVTRESSGLKGATVVESFGYDYRNRLTTSSRPHAAGDNTQGVVLSIYDSLDRKVIELHPDSNFVEYQYAVVSSLPPDVQQLLPAGAGTMYVCRSKDEKKNVSYTFLDRDGRVVEVLDAAKRATRYAYGAFGALRKIIGPNGTLTFDYDDYGRQISSIDAAVGGESTASYDGLDELVGARDPAQRQTNIFYDSLGRQKRVENADGTSTWTYGEADSGANAIGRLIQTVSSSGQQTDYAYEPPVANRPNRGLLSSVTETLVQPGATVSTPPTVLRTGYGYDEFARLQRIDYPENLLSVQYGFDSAGHVVSAANVADPNKFYWQLSGVDDEGYRVKDETFGNGVVTERGYEARTGLLHSISTTHDQQAIQSLIYGYDENGNLNTRNDLIAGLNETFGYDSLDRVTSRLDSTMQAAEEFRYDPVSSGLLHRDPVGEYKYHPYGRDWVKSAGDTEYTPDAFGNIATRAGPSVPGGGQEFTYTTFNLPSHVSLQNQPTAGVDFAYDAGGSRVIKQTSGVTTFYAGDLYQRTVSAAGVAHRFMIYAGGRAIAAVTQSADSATPSIEYLHGDSLGSVVSTTGANAAPLASHRFDTFGDPRDVVSSSSQVPYGYTGQEQDAELGLVNMHGRLYDPHLGQFLSPDPEIQVPYGQGLNRFAYALNSPLNYTDPSGFDAQESVGTDIDVGIGVTYFGGLAALLATGGEASGVAAGVGTVATTAAVPAVTAEVGAAGTAATLGEIADVAAPALSIATSIGLNVYFSGLQIPNQLVDVKPSTNSSTAGGSGPPALSRGGYANSAVSPVQEGATKQEGATNSLTFGGDHDPMPCGEKGNPACGDPLKRAARLSERGRSLDQLARDFLHLPSSNPGLVGLNIAEATQQLGVEHGAALILGANGTLRFGTVAAGSSTKVEIDFSVAKGERLVGVVHTHPSGGVGSNFSRLDIRVSSRLGQSNAFLGSYVASQGAGASDPFNLLVFEPRLNLITPVP